ncbi:MAG: diguanylate cyclase/phosphodiesterase with sensor [Paenibacillus sp.]|jgi:diguanylate cyclase (GGDEF)-like protein/PAS domain S-box-containing protein|nr:diguanylate cyclase/phosphodiesterase with sensor [Paenibacillus sp.]
MDHHFLGSHNMYLVLVSFLIALMACYCAIDFARRVTLSKGWEQKIWLLGGSVALGIGIWAFHFVAMLAYRLPFQVEYDLRIVWLSILVAIAGSLCALAVAGLTVMRWHQMIGGGLLMGLAISGMHVIGMAAMKGVSLEYDPFWFAVSIAIAAAASIIALLLAFHFRDESPASHSGLRKLISSSAMALTIAAMHYTGMVAVRILPLTPIDEAYMSLDRLPISVAASVAIGTVTVLAMALAESFQADRKLARQTAFKGSIMESAIDCIMIYDHEYRIIELNPSAERTLGFARGDMIGRSIWQFIDREARLPKPLSVETNEPCVELIGKRFITTATHAEGYSIPVELTITRIKTVGSSLYTAYLRDITERQRTERLIWHMAYYDMLTDLPNRNGFYEAAKPIFAKAQTDQTDISVLFVDLDRFKLINDTLGHRVGDMLLQAVAERLKKSLPAAAALSRLGGDEFLALLPGLGQQEAAAAAQSILEALALPFIIDAHKMLISASIGITTFPADGDSLDTLIKNADTAMYAAKDSGKNNYRLFEAHMNKAASRKMELEQGLRKAIDNEEFVLLYQPIYNIQTDKLIGVEALIRWEHPTFGTVPPSEFIPLAEETRLIIPLGEWIIRTACAQNKAWQRMGYPPIKMAVNLSMLQIRQDYLVNLLKQILDQYDLDPSFLELEITESIAMHAESGIEETLFALRSLGISISIDDFGTGYSALSYLKKLPIDKLKIDRSFVHDVGSSDDDSAILRAIVYMAQSLHLNVIAEGVETEQQLQFLVRHKCDEAQGYYFDMPLSSAQIGRLMERKQGN